MGNVFPTDVRLHRKYDLKGSTLGRTSARKSSDPNTVLKVSFHGSQHCFDISYFT